MDKELNIQNDFFNSARKDRDRVIVYLNSGTKLTGKIVSFDKFTIILQSNNKDIMVFKHAISTITTEKTFGNYMDFDQAKKRIAAHGADLYISSTVTTRVHEHGRS